MDNRVLHKQYKGHDIRSSPLEGLQIKGSQKWKVQLNITFPKGDGSATIREYLVEKPRYLTQSEAHTAGFKYGRRIIDKWIQTGRIPSS